MKQIYGELTVSALPLLNLLDVPKVHNVYRFPILNFTYLWHKGLLPNLFSNYFQYARNDQKPILGMHRDKTFTQEKCELIPENKQSDMLHGFSGTKFPQNN